MKYFFLFLFAVFLCADAGAQFVGARAIWQFDGTPNMVPDESISPQLGYDITNRILFGWDRVNDVWAPVVAEINFDTTGLRNRVFSITTLADTVNISPLPIAADMFVKDSTTFGIYTDRWRIIQGAGGGAGGPVSWNDLVNVPPDIADGDDVGLESVTVDTTLIGEGTIAAPMGINPNYIESLIDGRIQVEYIYQADASGTTIVLPGLPDTRYPISVVRGINYSVDRSGGSAADFRLNGSTLTKNYGQINTGERWRVFYVQLP
jgi:hypothetical protein